MGDDVFRNPLAQARVAELLKLPKDKLVMLTPTPPARAPRAVLARWRKQELAWAITVAELSSYSVCR